MSDTLTVPAVELAKVGEKIARLSGLQNPRDGLLVAVIDAERQTITVNDNGGTYGTHRW